MKENSVIGLDIDGVLADFAWGFTAQGRRMFGEGVPVVHTADHVAWSDFEGLSVDQNHMIWKQIYGSPNFWRMLNPCVPEYVFGTLAQISQELDVYFVTNRNGDKAKQQTEGWLRDHGIQNPTVIISGQKGYAVQALGITHYIDDKAGNAVFAKYHNTHADVYLLDRPYNRFDQRVLGTKVRRIDSVENFLKEAVNG